MTNAPNNITHVVLVLDESRSMTRHRQTVIRIVERQVKHLARRSQELDQETRVSIYTFNATVRCLIYDKDVLRLPSIAELYHPRGNTALIDATIQSLDDLAQTAQLYGDHAFLEIVVTDGEENCNRAAAPRLRAKLAGLPEHWTVACMVPNALGKDEAQAYGFLPGNIAIWDASSTAGVEAAGDVIEQATDNFLTGRSRGVHSTQALFSTGLDAVNAATVKAALTALDPRVYQVLRVQQEDYIRPFVESHGLTYVKGNGFYQLTKKELIQRNKKILIREKRAGGRIFGGADARELLGLRNADEQVSPDYNPEFEVFVQSSSVNRKLMRGTDLVLMR